MKFNIRFQLKKSNAPKHKIYLFCRWTSGTEKRKSKSGGSANRFVYPSDFSVVPKNWNQKGQAIKNISAEPFAFQINNHLDFLKKSAYSLYVKSVTENIPLTKEYLKTGLDELTGKIEREKKMTLFEFIERYIKESENRINPKTGLKISYRSIQEYNTTFKNIKEFQKLNNEPLDWIDISLNTFKDFRDYLTTEKNYAVNNTAKHVDNFRQFLREAKDEKFEFDYSVLANKKITVAREDAINVVLSEDELAHIEKLELTGIKDKVRDLFLISCWTGLRISDFTNIKSYNIKHRETGDFIELYQQKTHNRVSIPCFPVVKNILNKWNDELPKVSDQKINMHIKEICRAAKINEKKEKQITKGGKRISIVQEKWEFVTAHTGRRTFCTMFAKKGVPLKSIMKISGHRKESVFLKYLVLTEQELGDLFSKSLKIA